MILKKEIIDSMRKQPDLNRDEDYSLLQVAYKLR